MLEGCYLMQVRNSKGVSQMKLYTGNMSPVYWIREATANPINHLFRYDPKHKERIIIDRRLVRAEHGKTTIKRLYRDHMKQVYRNNLKGLKDK